MKYSDMAVGVLGGFGVGIAIGFAVNNLAIGIAIGIALGAALGSVWSTHDHHDHKDR